MHPETPWRGDRGPSGHPASPAPIGVPPCPAAKPCQLRRSQPGNKDTTPKSERSRVWCKAPAATSPRRCLAEAGKSLREHTRIGASGVQPGCALEAVKREEGQWTGGLLTLDRGPQSNHLRSSITAQAPCRPARGNLLPPSG